MALVNTIVVDLSANTATLTSTYLSNPVETIIYTQSTNSITLYSRSEISISGTDFSNLIQQINIFQTALVTNFNVPISNTIPFNSFNSSEVTITFTNSHSLICSENGGSDIVSYYGTQSNSTISLLARSGNITIPLTEWLMLITSLNHYNSFLLNYFQ